MYVKMIANIVLRNYQNFDGSRNSSLQQPIFLSFLIYSAPWVPCLVDRCACCAVLVALYCGYHLYQLKQVPQCGNFSLWLTKMMDGWTNQFKHKNLLRSFQKSTFRTHPNSSGSWIQYYITLFGLCFVDCLHTMFTHAFKYTCTIMTGISMLNQTIVNTWF